MSRSRSDISSRASRGLVAIVCAALLAPGETALFAQAAPPPATAQAEAKEAKLPPEQLDALVAPIALYPDELLGQILVASTYPLEIVQLQQWLAKNPSLKDKALTDAVAKQPWDPSIQGMAALPGRRQAPGGRHPVDHQSRQRLPRPAERCHGRGPADAQEGRGDRRAQDDRAAEGRDEGRRAEDGDRRPAGEPRGRLRSLLQPGRRLRPARLHVPADLLSAPASAGIGLRGQHDLVRRRHGHRCRVGARRLGLWLRLGQQQHQRQHQQQLQPEREHQSEHERQSRREHELEPQSPAPRRRPVCEPVDREQVRRDGPREPDEREDAGDAAAGGAGASTQSAGSGARSGAAASDRSEPGARAHRRPPRAVAGAGVELEAATGSGAGTSRGAADRAPAP